MWQWNSVGKGVTIINGFGQAFRTFRIPGDPPSQFIGPQFYSQYQTDPRNRLTIGGQAPNLAWSTTVDRPGDLFDGSLYGDGPFDRATKGDLIRVQSELARGEEDFFDAGRPEHRRRANIPNVYWNVYEQRVFKIIRKGIWPFRRKLSERMLSRRHPQHRNRVN